MVCFQTKKVKFGYIFEGLGMKKVGIFYDHLDNITTVWYRLWPSGNLEAIWYISPRFGILTKAKSGNSYTKEAF
jgi:hypothetical protein